MPRRTPRSLLVCLVAALPLRRATPVAQAGPMAPCPATPNCVSTRAERPAQRMAPIAFRGSGGEAMARLRRVVAATPGARVVEERGEYLRAEFRTPVFRFVDDVEFALDGAAGVVHFRSASRVGRTDLGANRRRMRALTRRFLEER